MIREELKKIWRPWNIFSLVVLGFVFYTMFLEFCINDFPENYGGYAGRGVLAVSSELVKTYGTSLSEQEQKEMKSTRSALIQETEGYIQSNKIGKKYGLKTYEDYVNFEQTTLNEVYDQPEQTPADLNERYADWMQLSSYMESDETDNVVGRLYAVTLFSDFYHSSQTFGPDAENTYDDHTYTQKEYDHAKRTFWGKDNLWQNILPEEIPTTISHFIAYLLIWICLSICLIVSPLLVHDRMSRMHTLQYSSRRGRGIFNSQFLAVMLSAFLLTTLNLLLFGGLFAKHGTSVFFPCRMFSFMLTPYCWPNWTHGTWCLVLTSMCYLVSFGVAGAAVCLAQSSANYIVMLLKLVPLFAVVAVVCPNMMEGAFYYTNALYAVSRIPYVEGMCAVGILVVGMGMSVTAWSRVKKG